MSRNRGGYTAGRDCNRGTSYQIVARSNDDVFVSYNTDSNGYVLVHDQES